MKIVEKNIVSMNYVLKNDEGEVLDQTTDAPVEIMQGTENILPGLDSQLLGMSVGDKKMVTLAPENAYGEYSEKLIQKMPMDAFNGTETVEPGMSFWAQGPQGPFMLVVQSVDGDEVTVDGNHELAGQTLHFDIEIVEIREATEEELEHGHPHQEGGCCGGESHGEDHECCGGEGHTDGSECCNGEGHDKKEESSCCGGH